MPSPAGVRTLTASICAALLCAALGACGSDSDATEPVAAPAPASEPPTLAEQIDAVGLRSNDLHGRAAIKRSPAGDAMKQPTFDQCGFRFASEKLRRARRQVEVTGGDPAASFSNEVVAYRDQKAAEKAMREMDAALATCDHRKPVKVFSLGPGTVFEVLRSDKGPAQLPVASSVLVLEKLTPASGPSLHILMTYQQSGALIDANYLVTPGVPTKEQTAELGRQASITGARLQQVTAAG
jgi:hypothetical protein